MITITHGFLALILIGVLVSCILEYLRLKGQSKENKALKIYFEHHLADSEAKAELKIEQAIEELQ